MREGAGLADEIAGKRPALHYLAHRAGMALSREHAAAADVESNFAINYLPGQPSK